MLIHRELTLADIAAVLILVGGIITSYFALSAKVTVQEEKLQSVEQARQELKKDITDRLDRIEIKLDSLVDKRR